jgi:hypothetical protein
MEEYREIEKKFYVDEADYDTAIKRIHTVLEIAITHVETGDGTDYFWKIDDGTFTRVRQYNHDDIYRGQLTTKVVDNGGIINRFESNINLDTDEDISASKEMMNRLHGESTASVWKKYTILWMSEDTNVVVYETDIPGLPLILEIESPSLGIINITENIIKGILNITPVDQSLFSLAVEAQ